MNDAWEEYDQIADALAKAGIKGVSDNCLDLIAEDPEAFADRVRGCAYAQAMEKHGQ